MLHWLLHPLTLKVPLSTINLISHTIPVNIAATITVIGVGIVTIVATHICIADTGIQTATTTLDAATTTRTINPGASSVD